MQVEVAADLLVPQARAQQQRRRLDRTARDDNGATSVDDSLAAVERREECADALGPLAARRHLVDVLTRRLDVGVGGVGEEEAVDARALDQLGAVFDRVPKPRRHAALLLAVRAAEAAVAAVVDTSAGVLRLRASDESERRVTHDVVDRHVQALRALDQLGVGLRVLDVIRRDAHAVADLDVSAVDAGTVRTYSMSSEKSVVMK